MMPLSADALYSDVQSSADDLAALLRSLPSHCEWRRVSAMQAMHEDKFENAYDAALTKLIEATGVFDLFLEDDLYPSMDELNREVLGRAKTGITRILGERRAAAVFDCVSVIDSLGGDKKLRSACV